MRKILFGLIGYLEERERKKLRWFALLCFINEAADLFSVTMIIPVLNQALGQAVTPRLLMQIVFLGTVLLLKGVFELLKSWISNGLVMDSAHGWSVKIYELYCKEDLQDHNKKTPAQAVNSIRNDAATCAGLIPASIDLGINLLTLAIYFGVTVYIAGWIGAASCALIASIMLLMHLRSRLNMMIYGEKKRRLEIRTYGLVSTAFGSYKELKIDPRRGNMLDKYEKASADYARIQKEYAFMSGLLGIVLQNVMQAALFFALAFILAAEIDLSDILTEAVVYITLLIRMIPGAKRIILALNSVQYGTKYYAALQSDMERYKKIKAAEEGQKPMREKRITLTRGIRVEGLTFRYPDGEEIFRNASLEIPAGCSTALIGASGAGKTTFLDLILGLLRPQSGHIWYDDFDIVDGKDGAGACRAEIGEAVSYIPQVVYLNDETVENNVIFMAEENDKDKVIACLKCAQIWNDVQKMPKGLHTLIGQNGTAVSGGQRQRIALARALYKDFEILIMDEATAALDMETEKAVIDSIRQVQGGRTLLMVTHHMSLADECEHVYKIENQQLVKVR